MNDLPEYSAHYFEPRKLWFIVGKGKGELICCPDQDTADAVINYLNQDHNWKHWAQQTPAEYGLFQLGWRWPVGYGPGTSSTLENVK